MLKGGGARSLNCFGVVLTRELKALAILKGGGAKRLNPTHISFSNFLIFQFFPYLTFIYKIDLADSF